MTIENLDTDQVCFNEEGKPTPYFEDLWFQMVETLGGEGNDDVSEALDLALYPEDLAQVSAILTSLAKKFEVFEASIDDVNMSGQIVAIKNELDDINSQLNEPVNLKPIIDRLETIEEQL